MLYPKNIISGGSVVFFKILTYIMQVLVKIIIISLNVMGILFTQMDELQQQIYNHIILVEMFLKKKSIKS